MSGTAMLIIGITDNSP